MNIRQVLVSVFTAAAGVVAASMMFAPNSEISMFFIGIIKGPLTAFADLIASVGVPYAFGFAIILFTLIIKLVTLPLTFQQLRASKAMQELQPELQKLQKKHKGDREKLAQAQMEMYKEAGVSPLGGCLPMLIQFPIWIGLYRALFDLASQGVLSQGFFWIPSLAEPKDMSWVWPLPPSVGWATAAAYMVLPVLTVVSQIVVQKMMTPLNPDPQQASMNQMMMFMPIMFGFFAMQVPQGLSLYWVTSNIFSLVQQYFITGWGSLVPKPPVAESQPAALPASEMPPEPKRTKKDGKSRSKR